MQILVTGAAGYIGSHVVKQLLEQTDYKIVIIDNLSTGFDSTIETLKSLDTTKSRIKFYNQDLSNWSEIEKIFEENCIKEIIHFAAFSQVAESMKNPIKYYSNNTINTTNLINIATKYGVKKFIFSSTAAVYGEVSSENIPIKESLITNPINPYGSSKLFSESIIKDVASIKNDFKYIILRYFNVAGADLDGKVGECHNPETHLIPLVIKTALGKRESIKIFGDDYDTPDGTCIRDYIHVCDLADAHIEALKYLDTNESDTFNCGYGYGYSVKEVVEMVKKVSNVEFKIEIEKRRVGDPAVLISDNTKIKTKMNWTPKYNDLELICKTALEWEKRI
ncbi:UDP-glucose 4-epimerase GalE [Arcobacter cloacae]|uniref:UDP-glucose 4-epimerase n=1 Tax=Arcobacter cloacae TaxID=1054034 RepID=A0A4Q0Z9Q9_9BACT|nr:UDP-glucose 4-epimerase GalE [Arcobacter cloacae]RXJ82839.1 UDP-glucose 4-epimerase GalE [Arcobacter cloacae]